MKVETCFFIFVTNEGLFDAGLSFFSFCNPWYVKQRSLDQAKEEVDLSTSLMSLFRASANSYSCASRDVNENGQV